MHDLTLRAHVPLTLGLLFTLACGPGASTDTEGTDSTTDTTGTDSTTTGESTTTTTTTTDDPTDATPTTSTGPTDPLDTTTGTTLPPPECQESADCGDPCFACVEGMCLGTPCEDPGCVDDSDCPEGEVCEDNFCQSPSEPPLPSCAPADVESSFELLEQPVSALSLIDLDGDERVDLVFALPEVGVIGVALNEGLGEFPVQATFDVGGPADHLAFAAGDLNGDGDLDLVVARAGASAGTVVLLGDGGDFMPGPVKPGASDVRAVHLADVDGDGNLDLIATFAGAPAVQVRLGDGKGALGDETDANVEGQPEGQSTVGPLLGLGSDSDLLLAFPASEELRVLGAQADATYVALRSFETTIPTAALAGDLDLDGLPEVVAVAPGIAEVWRGVEAGVWAPDSAAFVTFEPLLGGALVEHDGQPGLDLVAATSNSSVAVLHGDGLGGFACIDVLDIAGPTAPERLAVGDIDGDGDDDIVTAAADGTLTTLRSL